MLRKRRIARGNPRRLAMDADPGPERTYDEHGWQRSTHSGRLKPNDIIFIRSPARGAPRVSITGHVRARQPHDTKQADAPSSTTAFGFCRSLTPTVSCGWTIQFLPLNFLKCAAAGPRSLRCSLVCLSHRPQLRQLLRRPGGSSQEANKPAGKNRSFRERWPLNARHRGCV